MNQEELITPFMNMLSKFRDEIKAHGTDGPKELFRICDELRDDLLPYLGIRLEDRGKGQDSIWKYEDKELLIKEREAKIADKQKKEEEKMRKKQEEIRKKSTKPEDFFKVLKASEYSQFDGNGLPTHDAKGKELSQSIRNKLTKEQNK